MSKKTPYKFRAYDKFTKKMWQWEDHNAFTTSRGSIKDWFTDSDLEPMMFTGITDMDGKPIYEGDIVEEIDIKEDIDEGNEYAPATVIFHNGAFGVDYPGLESEETFTSFDSLFGVISKVDRAESIKVIGNIWENK